MKRHVSGVAGIRRLMKSSAILLLAFMWLSMDAFAGKHPYQELTDHLARDVREILIKHGMPVRHDRGNPWFSLSAGTDAWIGGKPAYALYLYETHEVPQAAQVEIIEYCMKLHESRGRRETIRLQMRTEARAPGLFKPKPYFALILNNMQ